MRFSTIIAASILALGVSAQSTSSSTSSISESSIIESSISTSSISTSAGTSTTVPVVSGTQALTPAQSSEAACLTACVFLFLVSPWHLTI